MFEENKFKPKSLQPCDQNNQKACLICSDMLMSNNTKVNSNPRYLKYKNLVCSECFNQYYPLI